jgi:hypothetical protein
VAQVKALADLQPNPFHASHDRLISVETIMGSFVKSSHPEE